MRKRLVAAVVLLVLAALAVVGWFSGRADRAAPVEAVERSSAPRREETPRLAGATPASGPDETTAGARATPTTGPSAARSLSGIVVDESGDPVPGATVFLPAPAGDAPKEPKHATTDADGRWSLGEEPPPVWVGVVARGFLPLHHETGPSTDLPLRLVLERGPELLFRVQRPDGGPLELDTKIHVGPKRGSGRPWPLPGETWDFREVLTIPAGSREAALRVATTGEVTAEARYPHTWWIVDPQDPVLVPNGQTVVFTVAPSCVLDFRVFEGAGADPLPRGFSYTILAGGTAVSGGTTTLPGGRMRLTTGLRPGRYVIRVWATGYRPRESDVVALTTAGESATVEVHLEKDPTRGNLRVSVPALAELPRVQFPGGESQAAPAFFLWKRPASLAGPHARDFAAPSAWGHLDGEFSRESDTEYRFEAVPEGEAEMLVGNAASGRVALVRNVRFRGGRTDTVTVALEKGIRFEPKQVVTPGETIRSFRIRHPVHGELPTWSFRVGFSYWGDPGEVPPLDAAIGPYPGPEIEVEVRLADESIRRTTLRPSDR